MSKLNEVLVIAFGFASVPLMEGQTFELLHSFQGPDGANPLSSLVQSSDGNFYGTTDRHNGGPEWYGTVFQMTPENTVTTLVVFTNGNGSNPYAALVHGNDGNFYGATTSGGVNDNGTVFEMSAAGVLNTLIYFNGTNGRAPHSELLKANDGNFYGTTLHSATGYGTVFRMNPNGSELTTLVNFNGTNGSTPFAALVQASDGNFYGTTQQGGAKGDGTVFQMTTNGTMTVLTSFSYYTNGANPYAALVEGTDGELYGTTARGGANEFGTIFKISTNGSLTTLFHFNGTNGSFARAALMQANDGNFYGTTQGGGADNAGTVFKMTPEGELTTLVSFSEANGRAPSSGMIQANDGNLYGTTLAGGALSVGTIFRILMPVYLNSSRSGNNLILAWPTNAIEFTLQSATNLISPVNWGDSSNAPVIVGAQFTVTNLISGSERFFRLKK